MTCKTTRRLGWIGIGLVAAAMGALACSAGAEEPQGSTSEDLSLQCSEKQAFKGQGEVDVLGSDGDHMKRVARQSAEQDALGQCVASGCDAPKHCSVGTNTSCDSLTRMHDGVSTQYGWLCHAKAFCCGNPIPQ